MVTYVEAVYSEQLLSVTSYTGRMSPSHCTATGKILLAYAPDDVRCRAVSAPLEVRTTHTITDPSTFIKELGRVRERGYAITQREYSDEITSVAAPVSNRFGVVDTAVAVCGPSSRLHHDALARAIRAVVRGAEEISAQLKIGTRLIPDAAASPA
jgi:DNA-binding IclR family transcriptional regulator